MEKKKKTGPPMAAVDVQSDDAGIRLDRWFKRHYAGVSHIQLEKLLRSGQVRVNGKRAKSSQRLEAGQSIRVPPQLKDLTEKPVREEPTKPARNMNITNAHRWSPEQKIKALRSLIIYEDDDVYAINKPAGLAVQGGSGLKSNLDDMLKLLAENGRRPKLVHRLDRETTGVILLARNDFAAAKLSEAFRERETRKIYWALTVGVPETHKGKISAPLIKKGEVMHVSEDEDDEEAKSAYSLYDVLEHAGDKAAFIALWPWTGRTHQLRVHMQYIGTPILGDPVYGGKAPASWPAAEFGKGLHLHARRLIIPHPRRGKIDVIAPLSPEMQKSWRWFNFATDVKDEEFLGL
jgi:23S rRNA pseudouridine955/2504/2580 synthase